MALSIEGVLSDSVAAREAVHLGTRDSARLGELSERETEVLAMASTGQTNAQMAKQLSVTVHAVKFHLASIYRKLGVANRTEAAVLYLREYSGSAGTPEA